ncbi:MAG TPA: alpha/beta fold hydrolase, partial [Flavisolibacter sp.]|nr:alpha/beta fold hydrolase [Flavisolibacter sp.]
MQEKAFSYGGKKIVYRTAGEGSPVVLLHGFGEDGTIWEGQYGLFPGHRLLIPDLPGSGQSEAIEDMSMEGLAAAVKALIDAVEAPPPPREGLADAQGQPGHDASNLLEENDFEYVTADPLYYNLLKEFVRAHRSKPTQAEDTLWQQLRGKHLAGYKFRRQHIVGKYIADFICLPEKLIVEVDGLIHQLPENKESDEARTRLLQSKGYRVVRFSNEEVINQSGKVLNTILQELKKNNLSSEVKSSEGCAI